MGGGGGVGIYIPRQLVEQVVVWCWWVQMGYREMIDYDDERWKAGLRGHHGMNFCDGMEVVLPGVAEAVNEVEAWLQEVVLVDMGGWWPGN